MDLDDQLAALAAGQLDDDTAQALRARAASDPALARRMARHARLQELLEDWEAPPLSDAAAARLDAAVADALDALGDEPLADRPAPTGPLAPTSGQPGAADAPDGDDGAVADLGAARARREQREDRRRGLPAWVPGVAIAAALFAVVGTGVLAGGGLVGGDDDAADTLADAPALESDDAAEDGDDTEQRAVDESAQDAVDSEEAAVAPADPPAVDLAEGELLALLDGVAAGDQDDGAVQDDGAAAGDADLAAPTAGCVAEALERDTAPADGRDVWLTTTGRYAGQDAVFVVVRTPTAQGERYDVLAYDPVDCSLLASDDEVR